MNRHKRKYIPNLARTFNTRTQRYRVPWSVLSTQERRKRYKQALQADRNGLAISNVGSFVEFAKRQREIDKYQPAFAKRTSLGHRMPPLFGTREGTLAMAILRCTGPITIRELARARRCDASGTFRIIQRLLKAGVVSKASAGRRWVGVNRTHPAYRNLEILLDALVHGYGVRFQQQANRRRTLPGRTCPKSKPIDDHIFGSHVRSHSILLLAALGSADCTQLARLLGKHYNSVVYALGALARDGVLTSVRQGRRHVYFLADQYPAAQEFRRFVRALVRIIPEYEALADAVCAV